MWILFQVWPWSRCWSLRHQQASLTLTNCGAHSRHTQQGQAPRLVVLLKLPPWAWKIHCQNPQWCIWFKCIKKCDIPSECPLTQEVDHTPIIHVSSSPAGVPSSLADTQPGPHVSKRLAVTHPRFRMWLKNMYFTNLLFNSIMSSNSFVQRRLVL